MLDRDVSAVAEFLHHHGADIGGQVAPDVWAEAIVVPWGFSAPNRGFMLVCDDDVVGVYLAFYSERLIGDAIVHVCNLATWYVAPEYRHHSIRLLRALLGQPGYHFTDLSPSEQVSKINRRLGFQPLDSSRIRIRTLPWPSIPGRVRIVTKPKQIERILTGTDLQIYRDHASATASLQLVVIRGEEVCHLIFRRSRPGRLRKSPFVKLLHVSNPDILRKALRRVARHLLVHYGTYEIRADFRVIKVRSGWGVKAHDSQKQRMFKSHLLAPEQVDYLYSELTHVNGMLNRVE